MSCPERKLLTKLWFKPVIIWGAGECGIWDCMGVFLVVTVTLGRLPHFIFYL